MDNLMCHRMMWIGLGFALTLAVQAPVLAAGATIRETTLEIPTYQVGPEDKNPPLWNGNVYPYPMQTDIGRNKADRTYRAVVLENDYLRVIVLPDFGGRIYAAHDKTNEDFDFVYRNHVIKPGLVALRGAWLSGGIEWNFPTRGHTVNTCSPVPYKMLHNDDGSVTCAVGTLEWVRRMKWTVQITVFPDRSCFQNRILLSNPTLTHNNAYFWANAAVHAWDDTKVSFSPTEYTYAGRRRDPQPWPIYEGRDLGWYKNTLRAFDYFSGTPADFVAAYNHQRDCGSVLFASRDQSFGKKFWTWGTARSGLIWENILTDADGQYIELQSGRLLTQGDSWLFDPHLQESWQETWFPIKQMDGFASANQDAAVNFAARQGKLLMALNVTRPFPEATVSVATAGGEIFHEGANLRPGESWRREINAPPDPQACRLVVRDSRGKEIIAYSPKAEKSPPPELEPEMPSGESASAEELCLAGYYAMKHWNEPQAVELFRRSLEKDPGFSPALRWLAAIDYKTGRFAEAARKADQALRRNEDDLMARYYRALSRIALGQSERVEEDLDLLGRRAAFRHVVPYVQASRAIAAGELPRAAALLGRALHENPDDLKAKTALACVLRHEGRADEAAPMLNEVLRADPLNSLAAMEKVLLGAGDEQLAVYGDDPQYYLEAACDYLQMNLADDAAAVLALRQSRRPAAPHPMVCLYRGYLADLSGNREEALRHYTEGAELPVDYVFPFRTETLAVLETGLKLLPDNWRLHYWLGTLLVAKQRWEEGLEHLLAAERQQPPCAVLYRNLGEIYWQKTQDLGKAKAAYERALACDPNDPAYYLALDRLYALTGDRAGQETLFQKAPRGVQNDYRVLLARAEYFADTGKCDQALQILVAHAFHPWEGWTGARQLYERTLHLLADQASERGDHRAAIEYLQRALQWPENLGTGRPQNPDHSREHYRLGVCYKALGEAELARQHFTAAAESPAPADSPWRLKARGELATPDNP
jgi:tetratricopeptide (TPR) repeat protein